MFEILPADSPSVSTSIWITLAAIVFYKLFEWYSKYRKLEAIFAKFPGDPDRHWLWGSMHKHPGPGQAGIDFQLDNCYKYPKLNTVWFGKLACVLVCHHPDTVKPIVTRSAHLVPKTRGKGSIYELGISWLGEGLLIANGDKWVRNRRLLTPAFHFDILKPYVKILNQCTDVLLGKIQDFADHQTSFEIYEHINLLSLDIILKCAFSYQMNCQQNEKNPYVIAVHRLADLWMYRSFNPFLSFEWIYNLSTNGREFNRLTTFVHDFADNIIKHRKADIEKYGLPDPNRDGKRMLDFLDVILTAKDADGKGLTDLEIRNEVDTFMFEGHDTTASGISFILSSLAEHPEIQEDCRQEVNAILSGRTNDDINWNDLQKLEYLTQCIKEGLRLHTPVFAIQRLVMEDFELDGLMVPAGTRCLLNLYNLHHNPQVWGEDHMEFKPERFAPERSGKMDPYAFLPFSAGQRNCIGQNFAMNEMKVTIAKILYKFKLTLKQGHAVTKKMGVVIRPENGIWIDAKTI